MNGYTFRSGVNWGQIPGFGTLDLNATYRIPDSEAAFMLQVQNLFSCTSGTSTPPVTGISSSAKAAYVSGQTCGLNHGHTEMINAPLIGTMVFVGLRWGGR